ncbi:MAG: hypothetical protein RIQ53_3126 [Pseudomonadota bacterium]
MPLSPDGEAGAPATLRPRRAPTPTRPGPRPAPATNRPPIMKTLQFSRTATATASTTATTAAACALALAAALAPATAGAQTTTLVNQAITETEVLAAQQAWCAALTDISATYARSGKAAAKALAGQVIDAAYGYQMGAVLFKPTLTVKPQTFRTTRDGALSYFVGDDPTYPKDTGFALKGWTKCEVANAGVFIAGDSATTLGKVHFTGKDGKVTTVDKTWGYVKDDAGRLRIVLHHSSLEYDPK